MKVRRGILIGFTCLAGFGCTDYPATEWVLSPDAQIRVLAPQVWMHTTWGTLANGDRYLSNGLLVANADGAGVTLVDGGWGIGPTEEVLRWVDEELDLPVTRSIITHYHDDRLSGTPVLEARGIPILGLALTAELGRDQGVPLPDSIPGLDRGEAIGVGPVKVLYPGPGHTRDNIVVWVEESRILFGGCAVRPRDANGMGNTDDADVVGWPDAIRQMQRRFPSAQIVVPSHGDPGGSDLLTHTLELLAAHRPS